ncbi:putative Sterigmatocystin 8-O-methyltransferase [Diaporthe sp. PMI_573]|nr:putative Sterigmatocystin 8-O-methyltransferase [Diaporthaceae sp. PMI_573]
MSLYESLPRIIQLANTISSSSAKIQKVLDVENIPSPSFDEATSYSVPLDLVEDHDAVIDATAELHDLLLEPLNLIHRYCGHNNPTCMLAIATFNIASVVPGNGMISFREIAQQTPMTEEMTTRLLRHAMTMRIFQEPQPGMVAHTSASKVLTNPGANAWLQSGTEEMWPAATKAMAYSLSNDSGDTLYDTFAKDADRSGRWARGMHVFSRRPQFDPKYTADYYDWASLGHAQVVFFGGGNEHIAMVLAKQFRNLSVVIQTLPQVVEKLEIPESLQGGVQSMAHDLFRPQPVKDADVYFLRWCLHNWSDKYCILILEALVPALKKGAKVIIQETIMPEPGTVALWKERNTRATDINMAAAFNGRERTALELQSLVEGSDARFALQRLVEPPGSALGMLEFVWTGQSSERRTT